MHIDQTELWDYPDIARLASIAKDTGATLDWPVNTSDDWEPMLKRNCHQLEKLLSIPEAMDSISYRIKKIQDKATANRTSIIGDSPRPKTDIRLTPRPAALNEFLWSTASIAIADITRPDINSPPEHWLVFFGKASAVYGINVPEFSGMPTMDILTAWGYALTQVSQKPSSVT